MLLSHAIALADARSYLAALAERATNADACVGYDRALLYLDATHGEVVPALHDVPIEDGEILYQLAEQAIEGLQTYGVDALQVELVLALIDEAHYFDANPAGSGGRRGEWDQDPFENVFDGDQS